MAVSRAPNCGMCDALYVISLVPLGQSPAGLPSLVIHLGNNLAKTQSGITLPLAPVLTLHLRLPHWLGPISAGIVTVVQASVSALMVITVMAMFSGSLGAGEGMLLGKLLLLSGHFGPLKVTMHQAWHGHLQAPSLVRQNDVGEHLW